MKLLSRAGSLLLLSVFAVTQASSPVVTARSVKKTEDEDKGKGKGKGKDKKNDDRAVPEDAPEDSNKIAYAAIAREKNPGKGKAIMEEGIDEYVVHEEDMDSPFDDPSMEGVPGFAEVPALGSTFTPIALGMDSDPDAEPVEVFQGEEMYLNFTLGEDEGEQDGKDEKKEDKKDKKEKARLLEEHRRLATGYIGDFAPLSCNLPSLPSAASCESSPTGLLSALVALAGDGEVQVPCGTCYKYDLGPEVTLLGGLNIIGKLYVPPNYKSTLSTPFVFVQGELEMSDTNTISPENQSMKIILIGTAAVTFTPADSNAGVAGTPFNAGSKPFLVAGGQVNIHGWDASLGSSWAPLVSMAEGERPTPALEANHLPVQPLNSASCPRQIINHDFDSGVDFSLWSGGDGAVLSHDASEGTLVVSNLNKSWQGFRLDFTKLAMECPLTEGATYLITMRLKVDKEGKKGTPTACQQTNNHWGDCMRLTRKIMQMVGNDRYSFKHLNAGTTANYGEWFTFSTTWTYTADDLSDNSIGHVYYLENTEQNTTISMDEFIFELPSANSFPVASDACQELVVNGDAENTDGNGWAFFPMWSSRGSHWEPTIVEETLDDGSINKFYRANNRKWHSDSIRFTMVKECFVKGFVYTISLRVRIAHQSPLSYYVQLKGPRAGGGWAHKSPLICPAQSESDGWVTCSGPLLIEEAYEDIIEDIHFEVIFYDNQDNTDPWAVVDYDDISISFTSGTAEGLKLDGAITSRWGANADVHITSSTLSSADSQEATIESISSNADGSATLKLQSGIDAVTSDKDAPGQGVEVALLTRNIKIEADSGGSEYLGGYFQVFHTPGVAQTIEGVEFLNMGQIQASNRYPIQFLYSGDVTGTSVSRNAIRNSSHRCISIDGTGNATIASNVGHDTAGHCFYFGHESADNTVIGNLGSRTNSKIHWDNHISGTSDYKKSTFAIYSSQNDYVGNVAGGGEGRGFYMYNDWRTLGEDGADTGKGNMRRLAMRTFKDNKSHSNAEQGFCLYDFEQFFTFRDEINVPIFENVQAYRNQHHGVHTNNIGSAKFIGGSIIDNQWGLEILRSDGVLVQDMEIKGYTDLIKDITTPSNRIKLCSKSDWTHDGIVMMSTRWRYGETDQGRGLRLKNVEFSDFDKNTGACSRSWPIAISYITKDGGRYDYTSSFENVAISDSRGQMIDLCKASSWYGVTGLTITDINGAFDPAGTSSGPSAIVSNSQHMTSILPSGTCTDYPNSCMAYCTGVCLRIVTFTVEQFGTENWVLEVTNQSGGTTLVPGIIQNGDYNFFSHAWRTRRFLVSLPAGAYTAQFLDENGTPAWPAFVEEVWEKEPDCTGSASPGEIILVKPAVDADYCANMIRNGGQDATLSTSEPWSHTDPGVEVGTGLGLGGSDAIKTINRVGHWTGLSQNIDTRCIDLLNNGFFEFSAWMRILNDDGTAATNINPNTEWYYNQSPILTLNTRLYRDETTKSFIYTAEYRDKAHISRPYIAGGWNLVHGIFRLSSVPRVFLELERAPNDVEFIIDDVSLAPFQCDESNLLMNGDLEDSHVSKFWDTWGGSVALDMVVGYGGTGNALKAFQRPHYSHGMAQVINTDCVGSGDRLGFKAKIKFETGGVTTTCNPNTWDGSTRCSDFFMHTSKNGLRLYRRVAQINVDDPVDGWYLISGIYTLDDNTAEADYSKIYFDGTATSRDVIVDDVSISHLPIDCDNLVMNPSFEEDESYWISTDRTRSKLSLFSPGADGASDFALRSYSRSRDWEGFRQVLDKRCIVPGNEYTISAKFRLLNATSSEGGSCDTNVQYINNRQCPHVVIYGWGCDGGDVYWTFWNQESNFDWDTDGFNDFSNGFTVDERLASCDVVNLYVHRVNPALEIVMDDMKISATTTEPPSVSPTAAPTGTIIIVTENPTSSPTSMPTVSSVTNCPPIGTAPLEVDAGPVMLSRSSTLCVLMKAVQDASGNLTSLAPVARSYDNFPWEKSAGEFATSLLYGQEFGDYNIGSQINLPTLSGGEKYYLTSYSYSLSEDNMVARLLETTTFGTTSDELSSWDKGAVTEASAANWVQAQMNKPMTSHREFFRRHANPRFTHPRYIGRSNHPCDNQSRWRKFTFSRKDGDLFWFDQSLEAVQIAGDPYVTVKLNGHVRTVVHSLTFENAAYTFQYNKEYEMCGHPEERVGGRFRLRMDDGSCQYLSNPEITFYVDSVQPQYVLNLPNISQSLQPIDELRSNGGEYIYFDEITDPLCNQLDAFTEETDPPIFGQLPDGSWLQFDPRLLLEENTPDKPIPDGGGLVQTLTDGATRCSNVPRTFLNEEECALSFSSTACGSAGIPDLKIELNADNIVTLYNITGQYVYGILGLPVVDAYGTALESPCTPGLRSRWEIKNVADCTATALGSETNHSLVELLVQTSDRNSFVRDIIFPGTGYSCDAAETLSLDEVEIIIDDVCFKRVHPEHMSVFDFTYWTLEDTHPGNMMAAMGGRDNPITKWMDIDGSAFLVYPTFSNVAYLTPHPIERWDVHSVKFTKLGRFGDSILFVDLPNELRLDSVAEYFGESNALGGAGVMVCGSPDEVANDPSLGYHFEVTTGRDTEWNLWRQREYIWAMIGLQAQDQLRQRMAWALAQLLVVVRSAVSIENSHTEAFLTYYDIFVRNAFGNYRDILKEVSYSPLMAENLSFLQSKSAAYMWETQGKISFADENYAREIMQLFSTGLYMLNLDGTPKLDSSGEKMLVYTNDEIMSFSRVWTGFDYQQARGNVEEASWSGNRNDPMRIQAAWRDKFPKSDLTGGYLGDGYPLCVDLPDKMFLRKGANYRLLGSSSAPELMEDDSGLKDDTTAKRFVLEASSHLKAQLCNVDSASGDCQYENTVTLNSNFACVGIECDVDTVRVVQVDVGIFYEYVRPACVEQAFFANAKKVIFKERWADSSCANPLLPYASEACCSTGSQAATRSTNYVYDQERVLFSTADARCSAMGKMSCDFNNLVGIDGHKQGYHWSTDSCLIRVKVNSIGQVAVVYEPEDYAYLHPHIREDNRNFFKVYWEGDYPMNDADVTQGNSCGNGICTSLTTGGCLCDTTISESVVFSSMPKSVEEVMTKLYIGAYDPASYDQGTYAEQLTGNGVTAYLTSSGSFNADTVFEVTDEYGRLHRLKNTHEKVRIQGAPGYSFRNAPSFMSILNTEADIRDAQYETEAALDHYLYHDNTAPFIAIRLIQRFTTSNPSPRYVKAVATAFRSGEYDGGFGTGRYGDLAAAIAAVLLDPEARSVVLDVDPFRGSLREPLLRFMALMRSMELKQSDGQPVLYLQNLDSGIGQMAHAFPTVFSFFLPEYMPDGRVGDATLVGPETMIMDMPKIVGLLNGMFSLTKYGLTRCNGGFTGSWSNCVEGDFRYANAYLSFTRPYNEQTTTADAQADAVINELSTILTSGRLSAANKQTVKNAYISKLPDADAALRLAQQLVLSSPEFHTTNTIKMSGGSREQAPPPQANGAPYKAVVYVMFAGGCDSYNMLVPHTCSPKDMYAEYLQVREEIAVPKTSLLPIDASTSNQVCSSFGLHPELSAVQGMYNDGDLLFFTNTGVLTKETDKENYWRDTETQLFAHNWMQREAMRIDPLKEKDGTGILGRIADALSKQGLSVGAFSIEVNSISLIGEPGITASPFILSRNGISKFNNQASSAAMEADITSINEETAADSGVFADLWSETLLKSLSHNELLYDTLSGKSTTTTFPTSYLGKQLEMVAKMIDSRAERGVDADVFYLATGGWDTHNNVEDNLNRLFGDVDDSFKAFADELKVKGVWDSVTTIETSDFARTLAPNTGRGSDHAWGGNYMMFGGSVKGGQIVGTFPDNLTDDGPLCLGRGRIIPTTSWDATFLPLAEWAGAREVDLDNVCPNRDNFPSSHFFSVADLFN